MKCGPEYIIYKLNKKLKCASSKKVKYLKVEALKVLGKKYMSLNYHINDQIRKAHHRITKNLTQMNMKN